MPNENSNNNQGQQQPNNTPAIPVTPTREPIRTEDYQQRSRVEREDVRKK